MQQYHTLIKTILNTVSSDNIKQDRTNTGTYSIFGHQMRFDLKKGFPLVTTKKCHLRSIIHELLWFLKGETNIEYLLENDVSIWDEWASTEDILNAPALIEDLISVAGPSGCSNKEYTDFIIKLAVAHQEGSVDIPQVGKSLRDLFLKNVITEIPHFKYLKRKGDLGPIYGKQWRSWGTKPGESIDQISDAIHLLKTVPTSRRIIVSAWNVGELKDMALMPCHALFQFYTRALTPQDKAKWLLANPNCQESGCPKHFLSCQLYQRSCDVFLGLPFNIASYSLLTHMIAQQCNMLVDEFIWVGGDTHIYSTHLDQCHTLLNREFKDLPHLVLKRNPESIFDYKFEDFEICNYNPHPAIAAPIAI